MCAHHRNRQYRYSRSGWRNESYRHYLAAKGVKTAVRGYFVNNAAKGNRDIPTDPYAAQRKSLYAQGYSDSEQERLFGLPPKPREPKAKFPVPDRGAIAAELGPSVRPESVSIETPPMISEAPMRTAEEGRPQESFVTVDGENVATVPTPVADLGPVEKRRLMDEEQTQGVANPPPDISVEVPMQTPGTAEAPPETPFSTEPLTTTPAQRAFMAMKRVRR